MDYRRLDEQLASCCPDGDLSIHGDESRDGFVYQKR
jgi:hypothetical protein